MRALVETDEGAARLGEVALVDRESRIGQLGTIFYDTLLDENAASHIAVGGGFDEVFSDDSERERRNRSKIHTDFMIGGEDVDVVGLTRSGQRIPLLRGGAWQI
jgi:aminopeptidase